jgi:tRNA nucleotidyltransferase/poly(A) polymerase
MGVKFISKKELEFLDPLDGLFHLRDQVLHPAGPDFKKDPVRFLRAIRFMVGCTLSPSAELKDALTTMNVSGFSASYLWSEMQKSKRPLKFYQSLLEWGQNHPELKLPISKLGQNQFLELEKVLSDPSRHESWMVALEWVGISSEEWAKYFSLSLESSKRLSRWAQSSRQFKNIHPENFHGEFEEVREKNDFLLLFDWYFTTKQLEQKHPQLPLMKMIGDFLPDWVHLYRFEPVKDVKHIDPPFRAKYQVWNLCQRL